MIQEIIPLTRPRTLAAALGPTILGAAFSYYAFGATHAVVNNSVFCFLRNKEGLWIACNLN